MNLKSKLTEIDETLKHSKDKDEILVLQTFRNVFLTMLGLSKSLEVLKQELEEFLETK